jgi:hypothetical protein
VKARFVVSRGLSVVATRTTNADDEDAIVKEVQAAYRAKYWSDDIEVDLENRELS